ncbi:MAG: hypothetical protein FWC73_03780 [Defluviitaleaceae bacterium]|nr:hypothetical protein [Defluviitaleaceae bacterium]
MPTYQVDYEAVNTKLVQMRNHITTSVDQAATNEYRQINNGLVSVDGAFQSELLQIMELNRQKALACTSVMERLLSFMTNASRQMQISEEQLARIFRAPRR